MMPFERQTPPAFWADKERQLGDKLRTRQPGQAMPDALAWQHDRRSLATWFHEQVRPPSQPRLCAYCDGQLGVTSPETIDHFFPQHAHPELALHWQNLYPACAYCNQTAKGTKWSCHLLRPDVDLCGATAHESFSRWFDFDPDSGRLCPAPEASRRMRARVRLTLRVFALNTPDRCQARRMRWRNLQNAMRAGRGTNIQEDTLQGPYRFVAERYLAAGLAPGPSV